MGGISDTVIIAIGGLLLTGLGFALRHVGREMWNVVYKQPRAELDALKKDASDMTKAMSDNAVSQARLANAVDGFTSTSEKVLSNIVDLSVLVEEVYDWLIDGGNDSSTASSERRRSPARRTTKSTSRSGTRPSRSTARLRRTR